MNKETCTLAGCISVWLQTVTRTASTTSLLGPTLPPSFQTIAVAQLMFCPALHCSKFPWQPLHHLYPHLCHQRMCLLVCVHEQLECCPRTAHFSLAVLVSHMGAAATRPWCPFITSHLGKCCSIGLMFILLLPALGWVNALPWGCAKSGRCSGRLWGWSRGYEGYCEENHDSLGLCLAFNTVNSTSALQTVKLLRAEKVHFIFIALFFKHKHVIDQFFFCLNGSEDQICVANCHITL